MSQESHNPELFISLPQTYDYPQFRLFSSVQNSKNGDIFSNHYEKIIFVKNSIYMTAAYCRNLAIDWLLNILLGASEIDHLAKVKPFKALIHSAK